MKKNFWTKHALAALFTTSMLFASPAPALAGAPGSDETSHENTVNDPIEGLNRGIFAFNEAVDTVLLRPAAILYRTVLPDFARHAIYNALNNLGEPIDFANLVLQGEVSDAGNSLMRFVLNSTVGVAGIFEVAEDFGLPKRDEDFGQTLAVWGVGEGPYMVLPILGPSNPRDLVGRLTDGFVFDPWWHWAENNDEEDWYIFSRVLDAVDTRARHLGTLDDLKRSSVDYYASMRSLYRQRRNYKINDGFVPDDF